MNLKGVLLTFYIAITAFMFINLEVSIPLWSSFFLTAIILFSITAYHLFYQNGWFLNIKSLSVSFFGLSLGYLEQDTSSAATK